MLIANRKWSKRSSACRCETLSRLRDVLLLRAPFSARLGSGRIALAKIP
jgi:hypothetical protein